MISLKDFAEDQNVSYEAIRKQVKRYSEDLKGHISVQGKTQYLDETAQEFLKAKRRQNPVVVHEEQKDNDLEALRNDRDNLRLHLLEAQKQIIDLQVQNMEKLQTETVLRMEAESRLAVLSEKLDNMTQKAEQMEKERDTARQEAEQYVPWIFGLFRRKR